MYCGFSDDDDLTIQQQLALEQHGLAVNEIRRANESLKNRCLATVGAASFALSFGSMLSIESKQFGLLTYLLATLAWGTAVAIAVVAVRSCIPTTHDVVLPPTVSATYRHYLAKDINELFDQAVADSLVIYNSEKETAKVLSRRLSIMVGLLISFLILIFALSAIPVANP